MFRSLSKEEIKEFRKYARDNHKPGDIIQNSIHHPVIVMESMRIDEENNVESNLEY